MSDKIQVCSFSLAQCFKNTCCLGRRMHIFVFILHDNLCYMYMLIPVYSNAYVLNVMKHISTMCMSSATWLVSSKYASTRGIRWHCLMTEWVYEVFSNILLQLICDAESQMKPNNLVLTQSHAMAKHHKSKPPQNPPAGCLQITATYCIL